MQAHRNQEPDHPKQNHFDSNNLNQVPSSNMEERVFFLVLKTNTPS